MDADIIIVGAGFAGLAAARHLHFRGRKVLVLEARERVGGRVYTVRIPGGGYLDMGGQWIGPSQDRCYSLIKELGLRTFPTYNRGKNIIAFGDKKTFHEGLIPRLDPFSLMNVAWVLHRLERMARAIDNTQPWKAFDAPRLDATTLAVFLNRMIWRRPARQVIEAGLETALAASPSEVSLLQLLFYIRSGRDLNTLLSVENGAQQDRLEGGMQRLAEEMAAPFVECIRFNAPARRIAQSQSGAAVFGQDYMYRAPRVIVAIPPPLAHRLEFDPVLPGVKDQALQHVVMGAIVKCQAVYDRPWWRERGWSGQALTDEGYALQATFDNSPADASKGVLLGFAAAGRARRMAALSPAQRQALVVRELARLFGEPAANIEMYADLCWADEPWSRGGYTGFFTPGAWTAFAGALAQAHGRVHWAGTETATVWNGYIEGAIRSGERAAEEVVARM
jgi:monoamine oxidase